MTAEYPDQDRVIDAISSIVAQSVREIARRAEVSEKITGRVVRRLEKEGTLERKGNRYRYENAVPWASVRSQGEPLPPLSVPHSIVSDGSRKGYKVILKKKSAVDLARAVVGRKVA